MVWVLKFSPGEVALTTRNLPRGNQYVEDHLRSARHPLRRRLGLISSFDIITRRSPSCGSSSAKLSASPTAEAGDQPPHTLELIQSSSRRFGQTDHEPAFGRSAYGTATVAAPFRPRIRHLQRRHSPAKDVALGVPMQRAQAVEHPSCHYPGIDLSRADFGERT